MENVDPDKTEIQSVNEFKSNDDIIKTLGTGWQPLSDKFCFKFNGNNSSPQPVTKRYVLSGISKLYDPLGLHSEKNTCHFNMFG